MNRQWIDNTISPLPEGDFDQQFSISLKEIYRIARRRLVIIVSAILVCVILAGIYAFSVQPIYRAETSVLVDLKPQRILSDNTSTSFALKDNQVIASEIEVILSGQLLQRAATSLNIYATTKFSPPSSLSLVKKWIVGWFGTSTEENLEARRRQKIFSGFRSGASARRIGRTYVIRISYETTDPQHAAEVANEIAQAYLDDKLETRFTATKRTNDWLRQRLNVLQKEVIAADRAVELYKEKNDLTDVSSGLISDQQLSELNSQLILARAKTSQTKTRYDRIKFIIREKNADAAAEDVLNSQVISNLRQRYAAAQIRAREIESKFGKKHLAFINLSGEVKRIQALILEELKRIEQSYESAFEIAKARQLAFEGELAKLKGIHVFSNQKQVKLRDLKRQADAGRELYKGMLSTFRKSSERESLPDIRARIIEFANSFNGPIKPNKKLILILGLIIGIAAGGGLAALSEALDNKIWAPKDIEKILNRNNLGLIPKLAFNVPDLASEARKLLRQQKPNPENQAAMVKLQLLQPELLTPFREILADRFTQFSEVQRNILISIQLEAKAKKQEGAQIIAFISTVPDEGKSTNSLFQALFQAKSGQRTLLIDTDFRRPFLSRWLTPNRQRGINDLAFDSSPDLRRYIWRDDETGLNFLPISSGGPNDRNRDAFITGDIVSTIKELRQYYDFIIVDLPPILIIPDARILADTIDQIVYVVEWGKISKDAVTLALKNSPELSDLIIGSIINKVDLENMNRYDDGYYGSNYYYS